MVNLKLKPILTDATNHIFRFAASHRISFLFSQIERLLFEKKEETKRLFVF